MYSGIAPASPIWPARRVCTLVLQKRTREVKSSASMQPSDHMSTFWLYGRPRTTSGARYERDWT